MFIFSYFMLWYIWGWCPLDFKDGILVPSLCHVWQMVMCVCPVSDGQDGTVTRTAWVHISQAFCLNLKIKLGPWRWTLGSVESLLSPSAMLNKCSFSAFRYWESVSESILAPGRWASFTPDLWHAFTIYGFKTITHFKQHSSMVGTGEDLEGNVTLLECGAPDFLELLWQCSSLSQSSFLAVQQPLMKG